MESQEGQAQEVTEVLPAGFAPCVSSNLAATGFFEDTAIPDLDKGNVEIIFKNKSRWRYKGVPRQLYQEMLEAESIGKFYNANIKGNPLFQAEQVITETEAPK